MVALRTDLDWHRTHTRYLQRALEWESLNRPAGALLSGDQLSKAKRWLESRPAQGSTITNLQLEYIRSSEEEEIRRNDARLSQLRTIALAQEGREQALEKAE